MNGLSGTAGDLHLICLQQIAVLIRQDHRTVCRSRNAILRAFARCQLLYKYRIRQICLFSV